MGHRNKRMGAFVSKHRKPKGDTEPTETDKAEIADLISKTNKTKPPLGQATQEVLDARALRMEENRPNAEAIVINK